MLAVKKYYDDYDYDFNTDSTARKKQEQYYVKKINNTKSGTKSIQFSNKAKKSTILSILFMFSLSIILVYRFNIISEKNYQIQDLQKQLSTSQAIETGSQVSVEQSLDLNSIEAYAKQKLGMQKPGKNQIIYIDNSIKGQVQSNNSQSFFNNVLNKTKNLIKQIF